MEIPAGLLSVTPEMRTAAELNGGRPQHAISGIVHDQQIPIEIECGPLAEERRWQNALGIKRGPWSEARGIGNFPDAAGSAGEEVPGIEVEVARRSKAEAFAAERAELASRAGLNWWKKAIAAPNPSWLT